MISPSVLHLASVLTLCTTLLAIPAHATKTSYSFSVVPGYFQQDDPATNPSTFDYTATNFGLINRTYATDKPNSKTTDALTQWQHFARQVVAFNTNSSTTPSGTSYKVLWLGRHGEGYHNAAETYYGTPAWNCYWAEINGNATATWADAHLTQNGVAQAQKANAFWASELQTQKIPAPQAFYTSPLYRCLSTAQVTFAGLDAALQHNGGVAFVPLVKELLREGISIHTCDRRSNRTVIARDFPSYVIEPGFAEHDELWSGVLSETSAAQDARSSKVLSEVFADLGGKTYASITSHSGEIASILRVLGHRAFSLSTGAVIPVLVKVVAEQDGGSVSGTQSGSATTAAPSGTPSPHCTSPPVTSVANGGACVCQDGAAPVTTTLAGSNTAS